MAHLTHTAALLASTLAERREAANERAKVDAFLAERREREDHEIGVAYLMREIRFLLARGRARMCEDLRAGESGSTHPAADSTNGDAGRASIATETAYRARRRALLIDPVDEPRHSILREANQARQYIRDYMRDSKP